MGWRSDWSICREWRHTWGFLTIQRLSAFRNFEGRSVMIKIRKILLLNSFAPLYHAWKLWGFFILVPEKQNNAHLHRRSVFYYKLSTSLSISIICSYNPSFFSISSSIWLYYRLIYQQKEKKHLKILILWRSGAKWPSFRLRRSRILAPI